MISLQKKGRIFWAVGQVNGRRFNQSLRTSDRVVAGVLKADLEIRILSDGRICRLPWSDLHAEFLLWITPQIKASTLKKYSFVLDRFSAFLRDCAIGEVQYITPSTVTEFVQARQHDRHPTRGNAVGPEGVKSDLRILHRFFAFAVDSNYLPANPVRYKRLNTVGGQTMPFSDGEVAKMLGDRAVQEWPLLRAVILTFLFTGLRISDVIRLPKKALDLPRRRLIICTQKRQKVVALTIHGELATALAVHLAACNELQNAAPFVFTTKQGKVMTSLDAYLRRVFSRCGIEKGHAHRFRDTFSVRLLAQGASLFDISKMLGINMGTAEKHYAPYVRELQERSSRLINALTVPKG